MYTACHLHIHPLSLMRTSRPLVWWLARLWSIVDILYLVVSGSLKSFVSSPSLFNRTWCNGFKSLQFCFLFKKQHWKCSESHVSLHLSTHPGKDTILKSSCILRASQHPPPKWIQITLFKILSQFVRSLSHPVIRVQYVCFFLQYVNKSENKRNFPGMGRWVMAARISTLRQFLPRYWDKETLHWFPFIHSLHSSKLGRDIEILRCHKHK